jgi:hypothetical protein
MNSPRFDGWKKYRDAYRSLWLSELGGLTVPEPLGKRPALAQLDDNLKGMGEVARCAERGQTLIEHLMSLISNPRSSPKSLGDLNLELNELDRKIEGLGFTEPPLGPVTRMFIFAKENLEGSDALSLASQMGRAYGDLARRVQRLGTFVEAQG